VRNDASGSPPIGVWVLALGAVGFACGFFGPIALVPEANQGPLLGIFITGPGGVLLGLVAGIVARVSPLAPARRWQALFATCAVFGAGILFFCLPGPELRARIIDAEIRGCESPFATADAATTEWKERIAKVTWSPPRKGWEQDVQRMLRADPGVVLDVWVVQSRDVFENRKPWNRGTLFAQEWKPFEKSQTYFARFAGADCDAYAESGAKLYLPGSEGSNAWPPDLLPNYLGLQVLGDVPAEYRAFAVR
jgi:hypothetical protein